MKRIKNVIILFSLCLLLLYMAGCGSWENEVRTADEMVRLSNILFEGMDMNAEQENALQTAKEINAGATYNTDTGIFTAKNTNDQTLNIEFQMVLYNEKNNIIGTYWKNLDEWKAGSTIRMQVDNSMRADRAELASQIVCGDTYVRTDFSEVNVDRKEGGLEVSFAQELPATMRIGDNVYTFSDFAFYPSGSYSYGELNYTCEFKLTKVSGPDDSEVSFEYRFVGVDGIIYKNGNLRGGYMEEGETLLYHSSNIQLPEGSYKMEVFGDNVRVAA